MKSKATQNIPAVHKAQPPQPAKVHRFGTTPTSTGNSHAGKLKPSTKTKTPEPKRKHFLQQHHKTCRSARKKRQGSPRTEQAQQHRGHDTGTRCPVTLPSGVLLAGAQISNSGTNHAFHPLFFHSPKRKKAHHFRSPGNRRGLLSSPTHPPLYLSTTSTKEKLKRKNKAKQKGHSVKTVISSHSSLHVEHHVPKAEHPQVSLPGKP